MHYAIVLDNGEKKITIHKYSEPRAIEAAADMMLWIVADPKRRTAAFVIEVYQVDLNHSKLIAHIEV